MSKITDFYTGGQDNKGRTLKSILEWNDIYLETIHDFIQWIFPLHERSLHSIDTPVLSTEDIEFFKNSEVAKSNMMQSLIRFEKFLGTDINDSQKIDFWANDGNHNLLRITRVIRSLRLFDLKEEAVKFYNTVLKIAHDKSLSKVTLEFWHKAISEDIQSSMTDKFLKIKRIDL